MAKRLTAIVISVIMIMTVFCAVPVSAEVDYSDYIPGEVTGNMIDSNWNPANNKNYNQHNASGDAYEVEVSAVSGETGAYKYMARRNLGHPRALYENRVPTGSYKYNTVYAISGSTVAITKPTTPATGNVVFSFQVKTDSENAGYGEQKVQIGRTRYDLADNDPAGTEYPLEYSSGDYYGADQGMIAKYNEYTTFSGTFINAPGATSETYKYYSIGMPMGSLNGGRVIVNTAGAYLGYEYAYDLNVSADATVWDDKTDVINVEVDLVNQIGKPYSGTDANIVWKAMNTERTAEVSGITVVANDDGTAKVYIDPFIIEAGEYDIVAYSSTYNMAKGVTITVEEFDKVSNLELSGFSGSSVTATAKVLNKTETPVNAVMVIIMVDDKNQVKYIDTEAITSVTSADGVKTYTKTLTATDLTGITKAKAFLLDCGTSELPTIYNSVLKQIAPSVTVNK